jgi:hypothetical protein
LTVDGWHRHRSICHCGCSPAHWRDDRLRSHRAVLGGHLEVDLDPEVPALFGIGDQAR